MIEKNANLLPIIYNIKKRKFVKSRIKNFKRYLELSSLAKFKNYKSSYLIEMFSEVWIAVLLWSSR